MSQELNLQEVTDNFLHKIEAIHESTTFLMLMSFVETKRAREEYLDFLKKQGEIEDEDEDKTVFKLRMEFAKQAKKLEKKSERSRTILTLLPRNFLVSLVAEYDSYLGQLITELLTYKPEILNSGEKNISFTDLTKLGSIEAAREHIIAKEVETVLRKSHSEQFDWLSSTFGLKLKSGLNSWGRFIELTERRNLFVHCDGIVSAQYLKVCARNDVEVDKEISVGHALGASKDYITQAYETLYEIGFKLSQVLWRKLQPTELGGAEKSLQSITFELLIDEEFALAKNLLDFACCTLKKWEDDGYRRVHIINRAIAYKFSGDDKYAQKILDAEDWSACDDRYKLCVASLKDDFKLASQLMMKIGDKEMLPHWYIEWPAFREFRKTEEFRNKYCEVFGHEPTLSETVEDSNMQKLINEIESNFNPSDETELN